MESDRTFLNPSPSVECLEAARESLTIAQRGQGVIQREQLLLKIQEKLLPLVGRERAGSLFLRDIASLSFSERDTGKRKGLTLIFDGDECICVEITNDNLADELARFHSLIVGKKTWKDSSEKRRATVSSPAWDAYRERADFKPEKGFFYWLEFGFRFSGYFIPIDNAVDRLLWRAALLQALRPCCNDEIYCDDESRKRLLTLAPNGCSEEQQIRAVAADRQAIEVIEDPSERVQIAAVKAHPYAIAGLVMRGITPSRRVIMAAVKSNGRAISMLSPSFLDEEILIEAVRSTPNAIAQIDAPNARIQIEAVSTDPSSIRFIRSPTEEAQLTAVSQEPGLYHEIKVPCEEATIRFIKERPNSIDKIPPLSNSLKKRILKEEPSTSVPLISKDFLDHKIGSDELREPIVRELLTEMKEAGSLEVFLTVVEKLKGVGYDWPELDVIEKSLRADLRRT